MKQIINGVLYDTESSILLYFDEKEKRRYYMTRNQSYFILFPTGEIMVSSADFMKEFLGRHDIDKYIEVFGEPLEG